MSSSCTEVNMTNCYKHCEHFFERCTSTGHKIHYDVLIVYWMMSGYLGHGDSVDEAYKRGHDLVRELIKAGILKPSVEDFEMIELSSKPVQCRHEGSLCGMRNPGFVDLLDLCSIEKIVLAGRMSTKPKNSPDEDGNYHSRQVFQSQKGLKYIAHFNPKSHSLNPLIESLRNPSILMLRGCDHLFPTRNLAFEKYKTLTILEISGSGLFTTISIKQTISKLTRLRYLSISDPLLDILPMGSFYWLTELRWFILRGCSSLVFYPHTVHSNCLEVLDLSYTSTTEIPVVNERKLTHLFLTDTKIREPGGVPFIKGPMVLDLSRTEIKSMDFVRFLMKISHLVLQECTGLTKLPLMSELINLELLDVSGCKKLCELPEDLGELKNIKELNLSGCILLENLREGLFDQMSRLLKLNLSETKVKYLPSFANLTSLHKLLLRDLELDSLEVETWTALSNLGELDLHGLKITSSQELKLDFLQFLENLQIINLSKTSVVKLPDMSMLQNLKELRLADCFQLKFVPDLQTLTNLETLDLSLSDDPSAKSCQLEVERSARILAPLSLRKLVMRNRYGVERLFSLTVFDHHGSDEVDFVGNPSSSKGNLQEGRMISKPIQIQIVDDTSNSVFDQFIFEFERLDSLISDIQRNSRFNNNSEADYYQMNFKMLHADLNYIQENISKLMVSSNSKISEDLLQELLYATAHLSAADFKDDSPNLKQLFRVVVKLKLMFPQSNIQASDKEVSKTRQQKKQPLFTKQSCTADINNEPQCPPQEIHDVLHSSYQSLTETQKKCLLCFSAFPCNEEKYDEYSGVLKKILVIKKRILIYWWVGEGFIDPQNVVTQKIQNPIAIPGSNMSTTSISSQQVSTNQGVKKLKNIEDMGIHILNVLKDAGFIEQVYSRRREMGSCRMHYSVHSFVTARAKAERFFDFNHKIGKLNPYYTRSKRDCQLESEELESLGHVLTLFNVNGSIINIKPKWFSKMNHLHVLYLGSWRDSENAKHIEILDQMFLVELKKMKQLRLLSLQGLQTIVKLPHSVCKLKNLVILDLRDCTHLEELPSDIGSLKNLTHMDLTNCVLLSKLPKGISLISKLELLKGFKITRDHKAFPHNGLLFCCSKDKEDSYYCSLRDLVKLEKLRELSLVVDMKNFPNHEDLEVFKRLKNLHELKISWERSFYFDECNSSDCSDDGKNACQYMHLHKIEKLELWCFPYKIAPYWLHPKNVENLQKLYIVGGIFTSFKIESENEGWKVDTLRLKYLRNLTMRFPDLRSAFPRMSRLQWRECGELYEFAHDGHCILEH